MWAAALAKDAGKKPSKNAGMLVRNSNRPVNKLFCALTLFAESMESIKIYDA
jgi:hypothetical protein